jgi:hypothetical protein
MDRSAGQESFKIDIITDVARKTFGLYYFAYSLQLLHQPILHLKLYSKNISPCHTNAHPLT